MPDELKELEAAKQDQIEQENQDVAAMPGDDPLETRERAAPAEQETEQPAEEEQGVKVVGKFDDKRASVAEKFKAMRAEKAKENFDVAAPEIKPEEPAAEDVTTDDPVTAEPQEARTEQPVTEEAPSTRRMVRVKVNGQEREMSEEDVIAAAQKSFAADDALERANESRAQARAYAEEQYQILTMLRDAKANQGQQPQGDETAEAAEAHTKPTTKELDGIIDNLQVGDKEDAKAALEQYGDILVERMQQRLGNPANIEEIVEHTIQRHSQREQSKRQMDDVLNEFGEEFPEFKGNRAMQAALTTQATDQMRSVMGDLGVQPETIDRIREAYQLPSDTAAVTAAWRMMKDKGYSLPEHGQILRDSAEALRGSFNVPQPEPEPDPNPNTPPAQTERLERKRKVTSTQPSRATVTPGRTEPEPVSRQERQRQAVRKMRQSRPGVANA